MAETEIPQDGFMPEDFAEVARLLREYILADASDYSFRAVMSNNASTILAALDRASRAPDRDVLVEALRTLMDCSRAIVGASTQDDDAAEAFDMYFAAQDRARAALSAIEAAK